MLPCSSSHYGTLDHQIHFYTVPSLDPYPTKPVRHVVTFAVDDQHLKRLQPPLSATGMPLPPEHVDFCVVKRSSIALFTMKDRLLYQKVRACFKLCYHALFSKSVGNTTSSRKSFDHSCTSHRKDSLHCRQRLLQPSRSRGILAIPSHPSVPVIRSNTLPD